MSAPKRLPHPYEQGFAGRRYKAEGISWGRYQQYTAEVWGSVLGWLFFVAWAMPMNGFALLIGEAAILYFVSYRRNPIRLKKIADKKTNVEKTLEDERLALERNIRSDEQVRIGETLGGVARSMQPRHPARPERHYDYEARK